MLKEEIKFQSSSIFEGMTSIRAVIAAIDKGASDRQIKKIVFDKSKLHKISKEIGYFKAVSSKYGFSIEESTKEELDSITLGTAHGGIVAYTGERTIKKLEPSFIQNKRFFALIQGIEDPYNFGYSLRSLYACGCEGIILPMRNWMSAAGVVARSSAGASELIDTYISEPEEAIEIFKSAGYTTVCADERTENTLGNTTLPYPIFLIIGGERRGISRSVLDAADIRVKINYARDFRASLSAASATSMFAYEILRQNPDLLALD